jgi:hypothetical protein
MWVILQSSQQLDYITSNGRMTDELEGILNEAVLASWSSDPTFTWWCWENQEKTQNSLFPCPNLPHTSLDCHHYANLPGYPSTNIRIYMCEYIQSYITSSPCQSQRVLGDAKGGTTWQLSDDSRHMHLSSLTLPVSSLLLQVCTEVLFQERFILPLFCIILFSSAFV